MLVVRGWSPHPALADHAALDKVAARLEELRSLPPLAEVLVVAVVHRVAPRHTPAKKKSHPPGKWRLARSSLRFQPPPGEASGLPPSGEAQAGLCLCSRLSSATICCHFGTLGFVRITLSLIADL